MKKLIYALTLFLCTSAFTNLQAQSNCASISVSAEAHPQTGFYKVVVSLDQSYDQEITVTGAIRDETNLSTETSFTVPVPAGYTTAATDYFFEMDPQGDLNVIINSVSPYTITKNGFLYSSQCNTKESDFSQSYLETLRIFSEATDLVFQSLSSSQQEQFFTYLDANGVASTASNFNISENTVQELASKYNDSHIVLGNFARMKLGYITEISAADLSSIIEVVNYIDKSLSLRLAPDGCMDEFIDCMDTATEKYTDNIVGCTIGGLSLLGIPVAGPIASLIGGVGCLSYHAYKFSSAKTKCRNKYVGCAN